MRPLIVGKRGRTLLVNPCDATAGVLYGPLSAPLAIFPAAMLSPVPMAWQQFLSRNCQFLSNTTVRLSARLAALHLVARRLS